MPKPSEYFTLRVIQFVILSCLPLGFWGQEDTAYVRTYGGPYFEEGRQIIECASGGYAVIGTTGSDVANNTNFYLLRLDASLECMWSKSLGGLEVEKGYSIVEDENENLFLCGYTNSEGAGGYDVLLIKTNSDGDELWRKTYGGEDWDFGYKIIKHPEGGFLICGKTYSMGNGGSDAYLLHVDDAGAIISEWTYGAEGDDEFVDVEWNSFSGNLVTAQNTSNDEIEFSIIQDIALNGIVLLTHSFEIQNNFYLTDIVIENEKYYYTGNQLVNGLKKGFVGSFNDNPIFIFFANVDGNFAYQKLAITSNEIIVLGETDTYGAGGNEMIFQRLLLDGLWTAGPTFGSSNNENSNDLIISEGTPIGIGKSNGFNFNLVDDMYLVKLEDSDITPSYFEYENYNEGCFTSNTQTNNEETFSLLVNNNTLRLNSKNTSPIQFRIYDISGRLILNSTQKEINISCLSRGIYLTQIEDENFSSTLKFAKP